MLVVQLLLPRFLVVEVVFFIHFMQGTHACMQHQQISTRRDARNKSGTICLVPVGNGAIREEPLFYDLDGMLLFHIQIHKSFNQNKDRIINFDEFFKILSI